MEQTPQTVMIEVERRRRRPAVSCALCRKRKLRCNREHPCSNCVRSKTAACVYENHPSAGHTHSQQRPHSPSQGQVGVFYAESKGKQSASTVMSTGEGSGIPSRTASSVVTNSTIPSTPGSQPGPSHSGVSPSSRGDLSSDQNSKLASSIIETLGPPSSEFFEMSKISGAFHFQRESRLAGNSHPAITRSVTHKTRFFGQSHWINIVQMFKDMFEMGELHLLEERSKVYPTLLKCKSLARVIKSNRTPQWPTIPTRNLPSKDVCDKLIDCYLKTSESLYRVLHLPSFKRDYAELWEPASHPEIAFIVQLKLVLAIGSIAYDDEFSLRSSAVRWIYEAQTWISEPHFKCRLGIQFLQIHILLLLARENVGVSGDSVWVSAGDLMRRAMHMGLHRDPLHLPKRSVFASEMHRRLWGTILELGLKASSLCGGPPLISLDDFDTEPPANFDDERIMGEGATPKPENEFTQISIAIALRKTFPARLAVIKFLNDISASGSYEDTLRLDRELRSVYKTLCRTLQAFRFQPGPGPSALDLRIVDFIVQRYISLLHIPFFIPAMHENEFAYSRKLVIENALKVWCAVYPSSSIMKFRPQIQDSTTSSAEPDLLERMTTSGTGFFRVAAVQAGLLVAAELDIQLREEQGLGPVPLRSDLLAVISESEDWCFRCVKFGETNIKGHLFITVVAAHIDGHMRALNKQELSTKLVAAAEKAVDRCLLVLEEKAGQYLSQDQNQNQDQAEADSPVGDMLMGMPANETPDWDFLQMSDAMFAYNTGTAEPINWMFSEGMP